jgi:immune inhibitor A
MVAPHPDLHKKIQNTKRLVKAKREHLIPGLVDQFPDEYLSLQDFSIFDTIKPWVESWKPAKKRILTSGLKTLAPVRDRVIVLYVDFPDQPAQISLGAIYDRFFSPTGKSFRNFYAENSYGKYIPGGEVHGPYRAPQPLTYYVNNLNGMGTYPQNAQKLVEDVISIATTDPTINWASFDNSGNGTIDFLVIVHAGGEAAYTGKTTDMWAHVWEINPLIRNGFGFQFYGMVSEFMSMPTDAPRTGVDSHEFGHLLGLPDLYDISGNSNGAGNFTIMSHGSWMDNGFTPVHLDAWCKYFCGFSNTLINQSGLLLINDVELYDVNYQFTTQYPNEYFMVENRQNNGFDTYLPANGILVWKVNVSQTYNNNKLCYKVGLVQADGMKHLENSINYGDPGDSYPGFTYNHAIGMSTIPNTVLCDGSFPLFNIGNITDSALTMSFIAELCPQPVVTVQVV